MKSGGRPGILSCRFGGGLRFICASQSKRSDQPTRPFIIYKLVNKEYSLVGFLDTSLLIEATSAAPPHLL